MHHRRMRDLAPANTANEWLARLAPEQRAAIEKLRSQILAVAPGAEEVISYGQPTFKLHGHLVGYGAFKKHLSFFPMNSAVIAEHAGKLAGYATSKGTIQFTPDKPIPAAIIKAIVKARIAQNLDTASMRAAKKKAPAKPRAKK
jgi:uncharacterized protein YdhG (YjbR/CyaY superfamily)